jgi:hypothetical protein
MYNRQKNKISREEFEEAKEKWKEACLKYKPEKDWDL